jgi:hypothetical protein
MEVAMKNGKTLKRVSKIVLGVLLIIFLLTLINFIPVMSLKTSDMKVLEGQWVNVYYENEEAAAEDVFQYADSETAAIAQKLGFDTKQDVNIYIYDYQATMQRKKYGFIGPMLGLDWYIGDNIGTNVILTSPANPGPVHDYDNNKYAVLHEVVHAYISVSNPNIHLWLTEGTALYLTNGEPFYKDYLDNMSIPSYSDTRTRNPIRFANCGGYQLAHTYIEYIDAQYGWDKVLELIESEDYEAVLGKTEKDIYDEWVEYIQNYYQ